MAVAVRLIGPVGTHLGRYALPGRLHGGSQCPVYPRAAPGELRPMCMGRLTVCPVSLGTVAG